MLQVDLMVNLGMDLLVALMADMVGPFDGHEGWPGYRLYYGPADRPAGGRDGPAAQEVHLSLR